MKNKVKVSVIVPVYNAQEYIRECINSLINQTLKEIEIICVDDGSTDASLSILKQYAAMDSRIIVKALNHKDAGAARNAGLIIAQGMYLAFLDSDDYFEPETLESGFQVMEKELSDVLVYGSRMFNHVTKNSMEMTWGLRLNNCPGHSPFTPMEMAPYIFTSFQNWPWNKMFRRAFVLQKGLKFQEIVRTNDMLFVTLALASADKISIVKEILVNHRIGAGDSLQQTNDKTPLAFWEAFKETKRQLISAGVYQKYEQSYLNALLDLTFYNLRSVNHTEAYRDILSLLKYRAEEEFGFMERPVGDYYYLNELAEYCRLKARVKIGLPLSAEPKITIVIPSFNSRKYIRECIESILEQTLEEIEVFCIDAGSTDGTVRILEEYAAMDRRFQIIRSDKKSYGYQINLGIRAAHGKYLMIVESDDYILPDACREVFAIAEKNGVEVLRADYRIIVGEKSNHRTAFRKIVTNNSLYGKTIDPFNTNNVFTGSDVPWSTLYNLNFLKQYDILLSTTDGASFQGTGLWFQSMSHARRVYFHNKSFYRWRGDEPESALYDKDKVYCMCDEYDFIRRCLKKDAALETRLAPVCAYHRFEAYLLTLGRIAEEFKLDFLKRFASDFKKIEENGELDAGLFSKDQWEKLHRVMKDPQAYYFTYFPITYGFWRGLAPQYYPNVLKRWFRETVKKELDLEHPRTFNEKIQWLKLYDATPLKAQLTDKASVRKWVEEKAGAEVLIPCFGVWNTVEEIDFEQLPQQFTLKATHARDWKILVPDKTKLDYKRTRKTISTWLNKNYALCDGLELQYGSCKPGIMAEKYLGEEGRVFYYRFFCFNGSPSFVCVEKQGSAGTKEQCIFDMNWQLQGFRIDYPPMKTVPLKPVFFEKMCETAKALCADFSFVSVEFCSADDRVYFSSLDFTPQSGKLKWQPEEKNLEFGALINFPHNKQKLPEKSFLAEGVPRLPVDFTPPKTDEEVRSGSIQQKNKEIEQKNREIKKKDETIALMKNELQKKEQELLQMAKELYAKKRISKKCVRGWIIR